MRQRWRHGWHRRRSGRLGRARRRARKRHERRRRMGTKAAIGAVGAVVALCVFGTGTSVIAVTVRLERAVRVSDWRAEGWWHLRCRR